MNRLSDDTKSDSIFGLQGRVAIVTGAASGYGRATAELLARFGVHVVACDIDESALDETMVPFSFRHHDAKSIRRALSQDDSASECLGITVALDLQVGI